MVRNHFSVKLVVMDQLLWIPNKIDGQRVGIFAASVPRLHHLTPRLMFAIASEPSVLTKRRAPLALLANTSALSMLPARTALELSVMTTKRRAHHATLVGRLLKIGSTLTPQQNHARIAKEQRLVKTG